MSLGYLSAVLAALAFLLLGADIGASSIETWESAFSDQLFALRLPWLSQLMLAWTHLADNLTLLVVTLLVVFLPAPAKARRDKIALLCLSMGSSLALLFLKKWYARGRPGLESHPLAQEPLFSFPSGHSMLSICIYGFIAYLAVSDFERPTQRNLCLLAYFLLVGGVGFSRVYISVHYPTDVLGGFLVGWAILWLAIALHRGMSSPSVRPTQNCSIMTAARAQKAEKPKAPKAPQAE